MKIRLIAILFVLFSAVFASACSGTTETPTETKVEAVEVTIMNDAFTPAEAKIKVGGKVVWKNTGALTYLLRLEGNATFNQSLPPGATFEYTFPAAGTFKVIDVNTPPAPTMNVVVEP